MKKTILYALGAINVLLLVALLAPYVRQTEAVAQRAGARRPDVMMIPGEVVGANSAVVYLVDTNNRQLGAVTLNNRGNGVEGLSPVDLQRVFDDREANAPAPKGGAAPKNTKK